MKKEWQKPELICLSINEDTSFMIGMGNDGSSMTGMTSSPS